MNLKTVIDNRHFLEGPRWHEGRVWMSDFFAHEVISFDDEGDVRVEAHLGEGEPSGLGWLPDGRLLISSMNDRKVFRREHSGELVVHADLSSHSKSKINDMFVDEHGNAFVAATGFDSDLGEPITTAPIYRVAPDGTISIAADGLYMPNGMTLLPGGTLVVAETVGNRLTAFDLQNGTLTNRRVWASFGPAPVSEDPGEVYGSLSVASDGISADSEGAIWVADALGNRVVRVAQGGDILEEVSTGDYGAFACLLVDETLYICSAPDPIMRERKAKREGKLLEVKVSVPASV